ncbi:unnamed protein product [Brachionus calyciflorus]|uniref:Uncharacterized protein n=1 Tax=Brachionus calyciflorus TaxID=104777 RepID=A0A813WXK3_9BILA|nr:unnamed protein product [Brachionus calyciflorus]
MFKKILIIQICIALASSLSVLNKTKRETFTNNNFGFGGNTFNNNNGPEGGVTFTNNNFGGGNFVNNNDGQPGQTITNNNFGTSGSTIINNNNNSKESIQPIFVVENGRKVIVSYNLIENGKIVKKVSNPFILIQNKLVNLNDVINLN